MNAVVVRRLLVFGVCAVGVAALYVAPGVARAPQQGAAPAREADPTPRASGSRSGPARPATSVSATRSPTSTASAEPVEETATARPSRAVPSSGGVTAFDPSRDTDRVAPAPVHDIVTASVTQDRLTLSWPPASDNVAVTGYRVWLNGFEVATTTQTRATVRWFNDDLEEHVVQVKALDAAGNVSASSPNLLVARPTPQPEDPPATPVPGASATPTPGPSDTPAPSPSPSGSVSGPAEEPGLQPEVPVEEPQAAPLPSASASGRADR